MFGRWDFFLRETVSGRETGNVISWEVTRSVLLCGEKILGVGGKEVGSCLKLSRNNSGVT